MFWFARPRETLKLPIVHQAVLLLLWTALFLTFGLLASAGVVEHSHHRPSPTGEHRDASLPSQHKGEHNHAHPCPCSALCQLPDGRVLAAIPAPPEWELHLSIHWHSSHPASERFAGPQAYLFPYPTGPPHELL